MFRGLSRKDLAKQPSNWASCKHYFWVWMIVKIWMHLVALQHFVFRLFYEHERSISRHCAGGFRERERERNKREKWNWTPVHLTETWTLIHSVKTWDPLEIDKFYVCHILRVCFCVFGSRENLFLNVVWWKTVLREVALLLSQKKLRCETESSAVHYRFATKCCLLEWTVDIDMLPYRYTRWWKTAVHNS